MPLFFLLLLAATQAQKPLPDLASFLQVTKSQVIEQLDEDELLSGYSYRRKTIHENLDGDGSATDSEVVEHDILPFRNGAYAKLISRNGVPLPESELREGDEEQRKKAGSYRSFGPPLAPRSRQEHIAMIDDMFQVWNFQIVRRENIKGRPAIAIAFEPNRNARPRTLSGKWMFKNAKGVAWVDETDQRIVRMRMVLVNNISVAWGLAAKVHKGTEIVREWEKVNNEVWLPSWSQKRFHARAFMAGFNFLEIEQYSDYRKSDSETNLRCGSPK